MVDLLHKRQISDYSSKDTSTLEGKNLSAIQKMRQAELSPRVSSEKQKVKKLFSNLQNKFSSSPDIEALIEAKVESRTKELYRKANYDALTHLPNRSYFHEMLEKLVQRFSDTEHPFSLLFLDLDGFKKVNDILGHHTGDELLRHVSARLVSSVREGDIVSRLGGDEFVILLADTDDKKIIKRVCERIIQEVSRSYWFYDKEVTTSASIGVSCFPKDAKTASELVKNADEALYVSKHKGKKTYRFFDEIKKKYSTSSNLLQSKLDSAIENGELSIYVEPLIDLNNNKTVGGGITLHWQNTELKTPFLSSWKNILNKSDKEYSVALWLIDSACYYLNQWLEHNKNFTVSVPVLESLWRSEEFVSSLENILNKYQVPISQIKLELSSSSQESESSFFQDMLIKLQSKGFKITLTEIGATPIDLSLLSATNIQEFKFDSNWFNQNVKTSSGRKLIKGIIQLYKSLDINAIVTGINSKQTAEAIIKMKCDLAQGSYYSPAINAKIYTSSTY